MGKNITVLCLMRMNSNQQIRRRPQERSIFRNQRQPRTIKQTAITAMKLWLSIAAMMINSSKQGAHNTLLRQRQHPHKPSNLNLRVKLLKRDKRVQLNNRRSQTLLRPRRANKKSRLPQTMCVPRINSLKMHTIRLSLRRKERISRARPIIGTKKSNNKIKKAKGVASDKFNSRRIQWQQELLKTIVQKATMLEGV